MFTLNYWSSQYTSNERHKHDSNNLSHGFDRGVEYVGYFICLIPFLVGAFNSTHLIAPKG